MEMKPGAAGMRNDLDFLKEEGEPDRYGTLKIAAVVFSAVACGVLLFLMLRGPAQAEPPPLGANEDGAPAQRAPSAVPATLVSKPQYNSHTPDFWIRQWNSPRDVITNAPSGSGWTKTPVSPKTSATIPLTVYQNSPVKLDKVEMGLVALPGGYKRAVGKTDIVNSSKFNVIEYRVELIWAANEYSMMPLEGTRTRLHQVYQKSLRPGKRASIQLVSTMIKNNPDGTPNAVRLTAWLDGEPGTALDVYQLQFGR
ncbi:MAG: hypothetical protein QOJ65_83 [Fimbriimonadaceae bacterium]|jgi:hypothetical protein|nr:hypothetical protein [Fimbriimonadaceae bacterium]